MLMLELVLMPIRMLRVASVVYYGDILRIKQDCLGRGGTLQQHVIPITSADDSRLSALLPVEE